MYSQRNLYRLAEPIKEKMETDKPIFFFADKVLGKELKEEIDDVMAVSFDTFLVAKSSGKVIGIRH